MSRRGTPFDDWFFERYGWLPLPLSEVIGIRQRYDSLRLELRAMRRELQQRETQRNLYQGAAAVWNTGVGAGAVVVKQASHHAEGGKARAQKLTPARRTEIAKKAAAARWKK